ncbi:MAG: MotA/TolQ/ExbB proton channel family protein [Rhodospirillales bacterium]
MPLINRLTALIAVILVAGASAATLLAVPAHAADPAPAADSAAPAATPVPPPPVAEKTTEAVDNPYGLDALWKGGDFVARGTLVILVIMSMGSWYIMFTKVYEQYQMMRQANDVRKSFWTAASLQQGAEELKKGSPFRYIAESSLQATEHHEGKLVEQIDRYTWVSNAIGRSVENVQSRLQDGLAFLATVGSTAPFVGLFGTVWGIYHALTAIGIAGQASIDKVAGPVGEALIMTAIGLAVAVPAVLGYNWLVRRNKSAMEQVRAFSQDLHMILMSGATATEPGRAPTVSRVK